MKFKDILQRFRYHIIDGRLCFFADIINDFQVFVESLKGELPPTDRDHLKEKTEKLIGEFIEIHRGIKKDTADSEKPNDKERYHLSRGAIAGLQLLYDKIHKHEFWRED